MNKSGFVHTLPSGRLSCDWPLLLLPVSKFRGFAGGSRHPRGQSRFREEGGGEEPAAACEGKSSWSFCVERVCCELEGERLATRDVHAPLWWRMNEDQLTWIAGNTEYDVPCYFILVLFRELSPFSLKSSVGNPIKLWEEIKKKHGYKWSLHQVPVSDKYSAQSTVIIFILAVSGKHLHGFIWLHVGFRTTSNADCSSNVTREASAFWSGSLNVLLGIYKTVIAVQYVRFCLVQVVQVVANFQAKSSISTTIETCTRWKVKEDLDLW
jgi:hypothetical protein